MLRDILFFELHKKIGWTLFCFNFICIRFFFFFNDLVLLDTVFVIVLNCAPVWWVNSGLEPSRVEEKIKKGKTWYDPVIWQDLIKNLIATR